MSILFGKTPKVAPIPNPLDAEARIDPSEDARQLRQRIGQRGGEQSTLLAGRTATPQRNIFKTNLGGTTRRSQRIT